ncbi:hypothetical protein Tco_0576276 [Tanacetum coccineum]
MFPLRKKIEDSDNYAAMLGLSALEFEEARTRLEIRCTEFLESLPDIFFVQRGLKERTSMENLNGRLEIVAQSKVNDLRVKVYLEGCKT